MLFGDPLTVSVRSDLSAEQVKQLLSEPDCCTSAKTPSRPEALQGEERQGRAGSVPSAGPS
jgi:hypothetical protein